MEDRAKAIKAAISAFSAALTEFLGWKGVVVVLLALMMFLDYVSGTLAAKKSGTWSSKIAREGLYHKGGIIFVVLVALIMDVIFTLAFPQIPFIGLEIKTSGVFLPLVSIWFVITEIGSIMENALKMGAAVPKWFKSAVSATEKMIDQQGENAVPTNKDSNNDQHKQ